MGDTGDGAGRPDPVRPGLRESIEGRIARLLSHVPGAWLLRLVGERPTIVNGATLDAHVQFLLAARRRKGDPGMCEPTVTAGRARYRRETAGVAGPLTPVGRVRELQVDGGAGTLLARHYAPVAAAAERAPLLVYLHGGGFAIGDLETHDEPCRQLCHHAGMHVLSVAYRLAPEHRFPCAVDDAMAALRWAQEHAESLGADPSAVGVGGDSAGGNLATVAALARSRAGCPPVAQLLLYPVTDADVATASRRLFATGYVLEKRDVDAFRDLYLGDALASRADPRASPRREGDHSLAPPALVVTAGYDPLSDEGRDYSENLRLAGVRTEHLHFPPLVHGFAHMTTVVPAARSAMVQVARRWGEFVAEQRGGGAPPGHRLTPTA